MKNLIHKKVFWFSSLLVGLLICMSNQVHAHPLPPGMSDAQYLETIKDKWADAKYQMTGQQQLDALKELMLESEHFVVERPEYAEAALWHGTILATYASIKGGVGALKYVKSAKYHLEKSLEMNDKAEGGFGHAVLGSLYARVPGWPMAFGDKKKADKHLRTAIRLAPNSIDANYYYGDYLRDTGKHKEAKAFLTKALKIKARTGKEVADNGRKSEIRDSLAKVRI